MFISVITLCWDDVLHFGDEDLFTLQKKEVNEVKRHRPNQAILDRLREEMKRLSAQKVSLFTRLTQKSGTLFLTCMHTIW